MSIADIFIESSLGRNSQLIDEGGGFNLKARTNDPRDIVVDHGLKPGDGVDISYGFRDISRVPAGAVSVRIINNLFVAVIHHPL